MNMKETIKRVLKVLYYVRCKFIIVSHLCANYAAPHCMIFYIGDKQVFHNKENNQGNLYYIIVDAAYSIGKIGAMSAAVQMEKRKEVPINCVTSILLPYNNNNIGKL